MTDTDDGMVLLDEATGRYWQLNSTGAFVLRALLAGSGPREAARGLGERHPGLGAERAATDVAALIASLHAARLVVTG
ncbi:MULTISPECIES: lasso peptide biosynthesis PqqD family chaperone [Streptomyces]|uniref:lasso peptide biosynthesis PqqD family chaperone n=1 Tax=Streptomyces TaxID=1883 RepID=UPI0031DF0B72